MNERITIISEIKSIIANDDTLFYAISGIILLLLALCILFGFRWRKDCKQYKILQGETKALKQFNDELNHYAGQLTEAKKLETKIRCLQQDTELAEIAFETLRNNAVCELEKVRNTKEEYTATVNRKEILEAELRQLDSQLNEKQSEIQEQKKLRDTLENAIKESGITLHQLNAAKAKLIKQIRDSIAEYKEQNAIAEKKTAIESLDKNGPSTESQPDLPPKETIAIKRIGYNPNNQFTKDCFPAVIMPRVNSAIKFPRKGTRGIKGATEGKFLLELQTYFTNNLFVYDDRIVLISDNSRPYEPDFTLENEKDGLNLFMDIEIDEPYDGTSRVATHYTGADDYRNQYFSNRGWMVIRFSEKQIVTNSTGCCRFIAEVIKSVDKNYTIPESLKGSSPVEEENFWTKSQAEQWATENFREGYLDIKEFENRTTDSERNQHLTTNDAEKQADQEAENSSKSFKGIKDLIDSYYTNNLMNKNPENYANNIFRKKPVALAIKGNFSQTFFVNIITQSHIGLNQIDGEFNIIDSNLNLETKINLICKNKKGDLIFNWIEVANIYHYHLNLNEQEAVLKKQIICSTLEMNLYKFILEKNYHKSISGVYFILYNTDQNGGHLFRAIKNDEITKDLYTFAKQTINNNSNNPELIL